MWGPPNRAALSGAGSSQSFISQPVLVAINQLFAEEEMEDNFVRASNEAKAAFGDGGMFIEKYLEDPRHIEIQVRPAVLPFVGVV